MKEIVAFHCKADAILIIDANAVLPLSVTVQRFQTICRWDAQILQTSCIVYHDQFSQSYPLNGLWKLSGKGLVKNLFRLSISEALYHAIIITDSRVYVKQVYRDLP